MGIQPALVTLFDSFTARTQIEVKHFLNVLNRRFPQEIETTVYRLVQEALTNVARHTEVQTIIVQIVVNEEEGQLTVLIQDEVKVLTWKKF